MGEVALTAKSRRWLTWTRWRQIVQVLALVLFLYLLLSTRREVVTFLPHDLFFRLDPLVGIASMVASRSWLAPLALGGVTLLLTLVLGRVWCVWLCPLGTLLDWTKLKRWRHLRLSHVQWQRVKYYVLLAIIFAAILGNLTLVVLDPITLLFRTVTGAILPALNVLVTTSETLLYRIELLRVPLEKFDGFFRSQFVPAEYPFFVPNLLLALLLAGILALNAIRPRFWCRYLCPLGALPGLVSRVAVIRRFVDKDRCNSCRVCLATCRTGAIDPEQKFQADPAECAVCLDCTEVCPTKAISFQLQKPFPVAQPAYDPSRRQLLASLGATAVGVVLLSGARVVRGKQAMLVRPPGVSEEQLLRQCIRCGECVKVCPTGGLQPSLDGVTLDGLWTPTLVSRVGYCDYSCHACGEVCPTGAIPRLSLAEKREKVLGIAYIDEKRCIPFAEGRDCIVCEEMCPVPKKAVVLEERTVTTASGLTAVVRCPQVIKELCIGCGICEYQCPLNGDSAIRIYPVI